METTNLLTFLVNSLWQVPLITGVAALAAWLMRHGPARHRNAVWVAALMASILAPLASMRTTAHKVTPVVSLVSAAAPTPTPTPSAAAPNPTPTRARRSPDSEPMMVPFAARTARILLAAYIVFLTLRLALLSLAWMRTVSIRRTARRCDVSAPVRNAWARCRQAFGLPRVELLASPAVPGPLMAGAWRRLVIVPDSLLAETSEDVLATALGHEMAHAARHDFVINVLCELLYLPISFNPVAWIMRRGIEQTREMACDEMVTSRLLDPRTYARSIVSLAAGMRSPAHPGYTLGVFDGDILEERIRRLVERRAGSLKTARLLLVTGLSALAVCAVVASGLALSARAQSGARPEIVAGVQAFNSGDYQGAVQHFTTAVQLEPSNLTARLHLANASVAAFNSAQARKQEQEWMLQNARRQYEDVLSLDPANPSAILGLVSLLEPDQLGRSRELLNRLIAADPKNATAYYTLAVKDWSYAYPKIQAALKAAGVSMTDGYRPLKDPAARKALRDVVNNQLDEGIQAAQTAIQLDPASSDAMAYLNLLYRSMTVITNDAAQAADLIAKADTLVGQAIAIKRATPHTTAAPTVSADSPPPLASSIRVAPPPPPPPPPPPGYQGPPGVPMASGFDRGSYWEVAAPQEHAVAETMVVRLRQLELPASIMRRGDDNLDHVVVGPYREKATLDLVKSRLEGLGFAPVLR